jgi:protein-S-isoprenylcysteine O-methyltransferase Ste14
MAIIFHRFVTGYQERTLHHRFGYAYARYVQTVPRLDPRPPRHG